ncbi:MAG: hypothetical protein ISS38_04515 [Candidatus Cloacimonetes bacterium]|nr:hypothetical protein [Candidatus Cloacimonadota bacterium]
MKFFKMIFTVILIGIFSLILAQNQNNIFQDSKIDSTKNVLDSVKFHIKKIIPVENKYEWNSISEWRNARKKLEKEFFIYQEYEEKKQDHFVNCMTSFISPGWGHFRAKSNTKGQILLGLQIIFAGSSYYFYENAMEKYDDYKNANPFIVGEMQQLYNDANIYYQNSQILLGLWAVVWGYTIIDTIQATEKYNRNLWEELKIKYQDVEISLSPNGIKIEF